MLSIPRLSLADDMCNCFASSHGCGVCYHTDRDAHAGATAIRKGTAIVSPRTTAQRQADVRDKLAHEEDLWVASASERGDAYLIPLSSYWDGTHLTVATPRHSRTARNLRRAGVARMALGPTRDVVILEGPVITILRDEIDRDLADAHAEHTGFDPRTLAEEYVYMQMTPQTIQAWREANELTGRFVMRDGRWLTDESSDAR